MSSVHVFKSPELHFIRILHNLQAVLDSHGDIPPLWRAVSASLLISEKSWQADGSEQRGQLGSLSQPHSFTQSQSQRTPAAGAFIFLHKKDRQHSKDSLCLHGASQTVHRGKWTACPHCKTVVFFLQITVLVGGVWLKIHVGQPTEAFDFLLLTPDRSQKHERKKEEEGNTSLVCMWGQGCSKEITLSWMAFFPCVDVNED